MTDDPHDCPVCGPYRRAHGRCFICGAVLAVEGMEFENPDGDRVFLSTPEGWAEVV